MSQHAQLTSIAFFLGVVFAIGCAVVAKRSTGYPMIPFVLAVLSFDSFLLGVLGVLQVYGLVRHPL